MNIVKKFKSVFRSQAAPQPRIELKTEQGLEPGTVRIYFIENGVPGEKSTLVLVSPRQLVFQRYPDFNKK